MNIYEKFIYTAGVKNTRVEIAMNQMIRECTLCHKVKEISMKRHCLCDTCYRWCFRWIKKKYGIYDKTKISEAINAYFQPMYCESCGDKISDKYERIAKIANKILCNKCRKLYNSAIRNVLRAPKRSGRYRTKG